MTFSFVAWQCPNSVVVGGRVTAILMIVLGVTFVIFALFPTLKQGRYSRQTVGAPATGIQRFIFIFVGALAAYEGTKIVVLCHV